MSSGRSTLDGLPKQFVASMRTLFEIMDDRKLGYVHLADIESRWREEEHNKEQQRREDDDVEKLIGERGGGLPRPRGVVESLRKVTPPNGLLSFERFCAGLKICLLRSNNAADAITCPTPSSSRAAALDGQLHVAAFGRGGIKPPVTNSTGTVHHQRSSSSSSSSSSSAIRRMEHVGCTSIRRSVPSQSVPPIVSLKPRHPDSMQQFNESTQHVNSGSTVNKINELNKKKNAPVPSVACNTATVRPNTVLSAASTPLRTVSMPQLGTTIIQTSTAQHPIVRAAGEVERLRNYKSETRMSSMEGPTSLPSADAVRRIAFPASTVNSGTIPVQDVAARSRHGIMTVLHNWHMGMLGDQLEAGMTINCGSVQTDGQHRRQSESSSQQLPPLKTRTTTTTSRRREPRRHTLANGIDYNMLKRMKQLEQEKDVLLQGLEAVDKARSWYLRQIVEVQDKMKYIGHSSFHQEYSTEAHQERLNFEMAQIFEVNQNLSALVESSERGFPLHMNLAVRQPRLLRSAQNAADQTVVINHVAELNRQLSVKSEQITQLEMEKAALVRELFQARSSSQAVSGAAEQSAHRDITLM